jgi:hypothetical protein
MYDRPASWRRKLRVQSLVKIARKELVSGKEFDEFSDVLEQEMKIKWKLVPSTRKQYLVTVKNVLENKFVLIC